MISKLIAIFIGLLIFSIGILILIVKSKNKKIKKLEKEIDEICDELENIETKNEILIKELKIEKEHNDKLAKKLADISTMSINDVLHELQNDKNG
jgi:septal ring factor EnvC (AmiA/AmiB activator)